MKSNYKDKRRLTALSATGGCGCKIAPRRLRELLGRAGVVPAAAEDLLVGAENSDDAAVWRVADDCAIVATADFFSPPVDVPRDFGRIAAANAISDVYAMGAQPFMALALSAMPSVLDDAEIADIFAGGAECCRQAGVLIAGGHSIAAAEPLYGLAVIGRAHPDRLLRNGGARPGDYLILSKPLGVGLMSQAHRRGELAAADYADMVDTITQLNRAGAALATVSGVHAMTDVTGFGLLGHLLEITRASDCRAVLCFSSVPVMTCARLLAVSGAATGASERNWQSYGDDVGGVALADWQRTILTDPQTGGGLLLACAPAAAVAAVAVLQEHGSAATIIGNITAGAGIVMEDAD